MKCSICHKFHNIWESCPEDNASLFGIGTPKIDFELPKIEEPIIPKYEPPKFDFGLPKIEEPIFPKYEPPKLDFGLPKIEEPIFPKYEPPKLDFSLPKIEEPIFPKYESPRLDFDFPKIEPTLPLPSTIRDISNNVIGYQDPLSSSIRPIDGGPDLRIEGNFVRDALGNMVGQIGPGNIIHPPYIPPGY
jgi:hypothetical protein